MSSYKKTWLHTGVTELRKGAMSRRFLFHTHTTKGDTTTMTIDKASVERVAEIISKENVRFINLQFTDLMGIVKQITISVEHWSTAVDLSLIHI